MNKLFTASGYIDDEARGKVKGLELDFASLPPFLRVLLTTDGTVTKSLESFFWEPVCVENLGQRYIELQEANPVIDLGAGASVLHREVELRGTVSGRIYTRATSLIRSDLLNDSVRRDLEGGKVGIGELLRELGLETYREVVAFGENDDGETVWRQYRISMNHQAFIQITESFPVAVFSN